MGFDLAFCSIKIRAAVVVAVVATILVVIFPTPKMSNITLPLSSEEEKMEIFGVKIDKNPSQSQLTDLAVTSWKKFECGPSKFPWTFSATETMYFLEGKVKVYCEGFEGSFEIGAGDFVVFPKGMKVTWDVIEAVKKHYRLDE